MPWLGAPPATAECGSASHRQAAPAATVWRSGCVSSSRHLPPCGAQQHRIGHRHVAAETRECRDLSAAVWGTARRHQRAAIPDLQRAGAKDVMDRRNTALQIEQTHDTRFDFPDGYLAYGRSPYARTRPCESVGMPAATGQMRRDSVDGKGQPLATASGLDNSPESTAPTPPPGRSRSGRLLAEPAVQVNAVDLAARPGRLSCRSRRGHRGRQGDYGRRTVGGNDTASTEGGGFRRVALPGSWRASQFYSFVSQRFAIRQATVKAGLKTLPTS